MKRVLGGGVALNQVATMLRTSALTTPVVPAGTSSEAVTPASAGDLAPTSTNTPRNWIVPGSPGSPLIGPAAVSSSVARRTVDESLTEAGTTNRRIERLPLFPPRKRASGPGAGGALMTEVAGCGARVMVWCRRVVSGVGTWT